MGTIDRQRIKARGTFLAATGLLLALVSTGVLDYFGFHAISLTGFFVGLAATILVEGGLWLVVRLGWDDAIKWDPHFVYVPMIGATGLLTLYIYLAPSMRQVLLMAWFAAPIFMAGLIGFAGLFSLSALMAV